MVAGRLQQGGNERPVLYGRERERARLRELLDGAIGGLGSLVLISGEAGIGKTSLVNDLIHKVDQRDCLVLTGGCYDLTTTPPYGPWSEAIRDYQPDQDLPPVPAWFLNSDELEKVGSQAALFEETWTFFATITDHRPLLIVLEDLHWADGTSLDVLRYLARNLSERPILLVVTYRDDEITRHHDLYQMLPVLIRESRAHRIHLNPLDQAGIEGLVGRAAGLSQRDLRSLVEYVSERSEGNPFYAEEILQGLEDDQVLRLADEGWVLEDLEHAQVPALLRQTLDMRLSRLSTATRNALQVAAVIGQNVSIDLWQALTELNEDEFEPVMTEALDARVLQETTTSDYLRFRHALLREALYVSLTLSRRRAWHRAVGERLAEVPGADPDVVSHHFQAASDERAAHWLIRAGVRAERSYAMPVAVRHYDAAQALLEAAPGEYPDADQARGWLLLLIGHLLRWVDQEQGIAYLDDAAQVARQLDDPVLAAYCGQSRGLLYCFQGKLGDGLEDMEHAFAIMNAVTASQKQRAHQAVASLFPEESLSSPSATSGGTMFQIDDLTGLDLNIQTYVLWLAFAGRFQEAMRVGEALIDQIAQATEDPLVVQDFARDTYYGLAMAANWLGRPEEAARWQTLALNAYEALAHHVLVRGTRFWELEHLITYRTDQLAERRRVATAVVAAGERASRALHGASPRAFVLRLDLLEGRWDVAREMMYALIGDRQDPLALVLPALAFTTLRREAADDRFAAAIWDLARSATPAGPATEPGQTWWVLGITALQLSAEFALDEEDFDAARGWIAAIDRWLDWSGVVLGRAEAQLLWARYHRLAGDVEAAHQHAEQALDHASQPRRPLALVASQRFLGALDREAGDLNAATKHLETALELASRCDAPYERALTMIEMAEVAIRQRNVATAREVLDEARTICESLDARRTLERVDQLQAQLRARAGEHPAGLSDREVEVLELVAQGMTNAEAGETLFISRRTVAQHLRSVYNKLGVNSRAAAVARWAELNN